MNQYEIEQRLKKLKKPTLIYTFDVADDSSPNLLSHIGGKPFIKKNENYPVCKKCKGKMNFVFQLHIPKNEDNYLYAFFYCFHCLEKKGKDGFEMRRYKNPKMEECKVSRQQEFIDYAEFYFEPTWSLPSWEALEVIDPETYEIIEKEYEDDPYDAYDVLRENIIDFDGIDFMAYYGGYPEFIKEVEIPTCSCCHKNMKLFLQLNSFEEFSMVWGNVGCIYIFACDNNLGEFQILVQDF